MTDFTYRCHLSLADTDAAGVLFFARQFDLIHLAYEAWLREHDHPLAGMLAEQPYFVSIIRAESEYLRPLRYGAELRIGVTVESVGRSSYVISYRLSDGDGESVGRARTVHVCIDKQRKTKRDLPEALRTVLLSGMPLPPG